jgi:trehalose utilization protein
MGIKVTVWNEFRHEKSHKAVQEVYPMGCMLSLPSS